MGIRPPRLLRSISIAAALVLLCFLVFSYHGHDEVVPWRLLELDADIDATRPPHFTGNSAVEPHRYGTDSDAENIASNNTEESQDTLRTGVATTTTTGSDITPTPRKKVPAEGTPFTDKNGPQGPPQGTVGVLPEPEHGKCSTFPIIQAEHREPLSTGKRKFPYSRPSPECRTFNLTSLEELLVRMKGVIKDPDLYRLFENSYPNTLDTTIKWKGFAENESASGNGTVNTREDLAFVITGDINAMWLRDSASQIYSYLPLLEPSDEQDSLASLWRGVINSHARSIIISPYCHSFQPPKESGMQPEVNGAFHNNNPQPSYDPSLVFDCKWELDSLASFLQISVAYYERTGDVKFFERWRWIEAVKQAIDAAGKMRVGTYGSDGKVLESAWTFTGYTNRGSETLTNDGLGNPTKSNGMVRSAFRPSDDASIYQLLVPANMMFATYLESASLIMAKLHDVRAANLSSSMQEFAYGIRKGIDKDAVVAHKEHGNIFAYEVDGFGSASLMDDANIPSLLAIPMWNFTNPGSRFKVPARTKEYPKIYENTRKFVLSKSNPYWAEGPILSAIGGPHLGPGKGWPMAAIVRAITAYSPLLEAMGQDDREKEVREQLAMVLDSTSGEGVIHESVNAWRESDWTRTWFGWANGLFGELVLMIEREAKNDGNKKKGILDESWQ